MRKRTALALALCGLTMSAQVQPAVAEVQELRIARQFGIASLPVMVMQKYKLLEKHLPRADEYGGKYREAKYEISWKNFTAGAPLTSTVGDISWAAGSMAVNDAIKAQGAGHTVTLEQETAAPLNHYLASHCRVAMKSL